MCCMQNELQPFTRLLFMLIWMNNKANKFGCTKLSRSHKVNQLLSAKPDKTVIALEFLSLQQQATYLLKPVCNHTSPTVPVALNQYSLIDYVFLINLLLKARQ